MVELVELFVAAGLLVGAALQPVVNSIAPSAIKIKVGFIFVSVFAVCNLCHGCSRAAKIISSVMEIR